MILKAYLILLTILGIAYHSMSLSFKIGDLYFECRLWQFGLYLAGIFIAHIFLKGLLRRVFRAFEWYRKYLESFAPSQAVMLVLGYKIGLNKEVKLNCKDLSDDKKVYLELIKFLIGKKVDRKVLGQQLYGEGILAVQESEENILEKDYGNAIKSLNFLIKKYGYVPWTYHNLRKCYLETGKYADLDELNTKIGNNSLIKVIRNEGKILSLKEEVVGIRDLEKKLVVFEKIYKLNPSDYDNLMEYLGCLQKLGRFATGIDIIKNSTESGREFIKIACEFFATEEPKVVLQMALNMRESLTKYVLLFDSSLKVQEYELAERSICKVNPVDQILASLMEIRLCYQRADINKVHSLVNKLTYDTSRIASS